MLLSSYLVVSYDVSVLRDLETPQLSLAASTLGHTVTSNNSTAMDAPVLLTNSIESHRPRHLLPCVEHRQMSWLGGTLQQWKQGHLPVQGSLPPTHFHRDLVCQKWETKAYWLFKCVTMCTGLWHFWTWAEGEHLQLSQLVSVSLYSQAECFSSSGAQPLRNNTCFCT